MSFRLISSDGQNGFRLGGLFDIVLVPGSEELVLTLPGEDEGEDDEEIVFVSRNGDGLWEGEDGPDLMLVPCEDAAPQDS